MSRSSNPGCVEVLFLLIVGLAVGFGVDCLLAQFAIWAMAGYGIASGFWHAFWAVVVLEMIIGAGASSAVKVSK